VGYLVVMGFVILFYPNQHHTHTQKQ